MENKFRSSCPIASTLDIIGDKWSLLIIRDLLLGGKKTFKEISLSEEKIATNILSSRLKLLERFDLISKRKLPSNKKENIYLLTEKGIDLAPLITEIILWSDKNVRNYNPKMFSISDKGFDGEKLKVITAIKKNYREIVKETLSDF
ncbi:transcriptional regulator, HxlR family [Halpernia humi]|uniref:Transcriptional regulator, HxlR family n=1 Tax=Halpernia humi TaxID=493375 RepID=A0A1H5W1Y8_9FLAO|nr:helix-turn-helix domain-containing protein [Halpernia humi]SEF93505.1 transcriptional regulator, HxlR family [Halpernia humi]